MQPTNSPLKPDLWYQMRKCFRKRKYETLAGAKRQARSDMAKYGAVMYPYLCRNCGNYHLTKQPHKDVPEL